MDDKLSIFIFFHHSYHYIIHIIEIKIMAIASPREELIEVRNAHDKIASQNKLTI